MVLYISRSVDGCDCIDQHVDLINFILYIYSKADMF